MPAIRQKAPTGQRRRLQGPALLEWRRQHPLPRAGHSADGQIHPTARQRRSGSRCRGRRKLMGLLEFPNPGDWFNSFKMGTLEREAANAVMSAAYSSYISGLWSEGVSKWFVWSGTGQGLKDAATAAYLSLQALEAKGFLTLTVPKDLLDANNLARFQTEY